MTDEHKDPHEQRREERLEAAVLSYHLPPDTPHDRIWQQLQGERQVDEPAAFWPRLGGLLRSNWWPAAALGLLVVGIWIGRLMENPSDTAQVEPLPSASQIDQTAVPGIPKTIPLPEESPASDGLQDGLTQNAEALLMLVSSEAPGFATGGNQAVADWARELLSETRLLLDSPHSDDERLGTLFLDLEFVLVQLVRQSNPNPQEKSDWILDNIRRKDLLIRLRHTHSPPGATGV